MGSGESEIHYCQLFLKKKKKVDYIILAGKNTLIQMLSLYLNHMLQINPTLDFKSHCEELFKELLLL